MPDAPEEVIDRLEQNIAHLPYVTDLMDMGKTAEEILAMLLDGLDMEINDVLPMGWHCNCSRDRVTKALISLGKEEMKRLIEEDGKAELKCHFCNQTYFFSKEELEQILAQAQA